MRLAPDDPAPASRPTDPWTIDLTGGAPVPAQGEPTGSEGIAGSLDRASQSVESLVGVDVRWPDREHLFAHCREMDSILAAVLLFAGVAYSAFGYAIFKVAAVINLAGLGAWGGWWVGRQFDARLPGMILGAVLAAAVAWPAIRFAVAACSGLVGFVIGVAIWRSLGLLDGYAPAGGAIGAVFLFMLSFVLFKFSIITFTSVQGGVMLLGGLLGLLMKYPQVDEPVTALTAEHRVILPIALFVVSVLGMLYQHHWHRPPAEDE